MLQMVLLNMENLSKKISSLESKFQNQKEMKVRFYCDDLVLIVQSMLDNKIASCFNPWKT